MKKEKESCKNKGFTLIEMLVVVLIIGILAGIALPQYQMAVTKARVASILPIMRRFKDALAEYKLQHGSYETEDGDRPDADTLGVNFPSDWDCDSFGIECWNDYWECMVNDDAIDNHTGYVYCEYKPVGFAIWMYQPDDIDFEDTRNMLTCQAEQTANKENKVCKALGGKLIGTHFGSKNVYKLY